MSPRKKVANSPARIPARFPFFAEIVAQCMVKLEETSTAVLTAATSTGISVPGAGHGSPFTTLRKK